jgi:valyl-tRNA synthetase
VVHEESPGNLWHIRYPVNGIPGRYVTVATTRPETMLGDTAVAVNAKDERYKDLHGKSVTVPLMNREIPIILDDLADPQFGTGVVKVTPAHDPNDFEAGKRHNLPLIKVIDLNARMTEAAGAYAGLDRFEARKKVLADLEAQGALVKTEVYTLNAGKCQRCRTIVEPLVSMQWFCSMKPLAEPAIKAVEDGRIRFVPENWTKTYNEWMYNIRDWCISRQLWWGHRIPAWHCATCGEITVSRTDVKTCAKCGSAAVRQDPDVLDTWFSSGLWPFSTLGWPDETQDLKMYYPTSLLITGFDILFFWVARMIMLGMEMMGDVPFRTVYIHGLVRDAERQKMSKTKGNTIDPLIITEQYGTDAVRFSLLRGAAPGTDIVLSDERMVSSRGFANKIWNAARFIFMQMERVGIENLELETLEESIGAPEAVGGEVALEDRWIFSRLSRVAEELNRAQAQYRYHEVADLLYGFVWDEFCDWYIELKKLRIDDSPGAKIHIRNLLRVFEFTLRLLHPVMPFLTEELWHRLLKAHSGLPASISLAPYPQMNAAVVDAAAEAEIALLKEMITSARALRADQKLDPKQQLDGFLYPHAAAEAVARAQQGALEQLTNTKFSIAPVSAARAAGASRSTPEFDLVLSLSGAQAGILRQRLTKEIEQLEKVIENSRRQLGDEKFLGKAPTKVVDGLKAKLADYEAQLDKSRAGLLELEA